MYYAVYLIFEAMAFRACSREIEPFIKRSPGVGLVPEHWIKQGDAQIVQTGKRGGSEYLRIDETGMNVAGAEVYIFVPYEPFANRIPGLYFAWNP